MRVWCCSVVNGSLLHTQSSFKRGGRDNLQYKQNTIHASLLIRPIGPSRAIHSRKVPQIYLHTHARVIGASVSEPHTSESNCRFFIHICVIYVIRRSVNVGSHSFKAIRAPHACMYGQIYIYIYIDKILFQQGSNLSSYS